MTWERLCAVPPLRDAEGTIVLEELDDDTRTATFRVYARASLRAWVEDGEVRFDGQPPAALLRALAPQSFGRFVAAGRRP